MNQNIKQQKVLLLSNLAFMYGVNTSKFEKSTDENINNTIEKGQISDAFQYSSDSAFKISMTGDEMKKRIATAVPALLSQKQQLKEIANTALSNCDGILPIDKRNSQALSYSVFSYEQREPQRSSYQNEYPQKTDCQKQMDIYNSAVYEMLEITKDIVTLNAIKSGLSDSKSYNLTVSQVVAISMGYTEDELTEKAEIIEIEKGGEGSRGGKVIGHTKSGKPIYANANHIEHKNFDFKEHWEAKELHENNANDLFKKRNNGAAFDNEDIKKYNNHKKQADNHKKLIEKNDKKKGFYDSANN